MARAVVVQKNRDCRGGTLAETSFERASSESVIGGGYQPGALHMAPA